MPLSFSQMKWEVSMMAIWTWDMMNSRCAGSSVDRRGVIRGDDRMGAACGCGSMTGSSSRTTSWFESEIGDVYPFRESFVIREGVAAVCMKPYPTERWEGYDFVQRR